MGLKEKRQKKRELRKRIYRERSRGEIEAMRRARFQATATLLVLLVILTGSIGVFLYGRTVQKKQPQTEQASESAGEPVFTVVLDAGHGYGDDGSALSEELSEADYTLIAVKETQKILNEMNYAVVLSTPENSEKGEGFSEEERRAFLERSGADCAVSVHICDTPGAYYSLLTDVTEHSRALASGFGYKPEAQTEYTVIKAKGIPSVRVNLDSTLSTQAAGRVIADGIIAYADWMNGNG